MKLLNLAILEDNDEHFEIIKNNLAIQQERIFDYKIERFLEVGDACEKLFGRSPDALLLDLNVLDSSGIDTFDKIKKLRTTIIVMSIIEDSSVAVKCLEQGAFYVVKEWIFSNPLLLHLFLLRSYENSQQREKIKVLIKERLGEFQKLIPRCSFCRGRIGQARFKDESTGQWFSFVSYLENLGILFTDGICPECFEDMRKIISES